MLPCAKGEPAVEVFRLATSSKNKNYNNSLEIAIRIVYKTDYITLQRAVKVFRQLT